MKIGAIHVGMPAFIYLVFTNPVQGREEEFEHWYTHTHVPDLLRVPGIKSAQRFRRTSHQRGTPEHPWEYLALYECEAPAPNVVTEGIQARVGTPDMVISSALAEARYGCYFEPIGEVVRGD